MLVTAIAVALAHPLAAGAQSAPGAFQCYGLGQTAAIPVGDVVFTDAYGSYAVALAQPPRICAPADVDGQDPSAPANPEHLLVYRLAGAAPASIVRDQPVSNQFGTTSLDVKKTRWGMVPSTISLVAPPAGGPAPGLAHFACHQAKPSRNAPRIDVDPVEVTTRFETVSVHPKKPTWLCAAADANGADPNAPGSGQAVVCYRAKSKSRLEAGPIYVNNQFGQQVYRFLGQRKELCLPATLGPGNSTTTTSLSTSTTTTSSTSTSSSSSTSTTVGVCGGNGETCCTGSVCGALLGCDYFSNTCSPCGGVEQPCCDDGTCFENLVCIGISNTCAVP